MPSTYKPTGSVRMGRPPKPPGKGRNRRVVTFVTEENFVGLQELASATGMSLSSLCNELIVNALQKRRHVSGRD